MSRQQINPNQNITFPTTEVPERKPREGVPRTLEEKKVAESDDFTEEARTSAQTGYDTENQLSSNLITVTLAFVALISAAVSSSDVLSLLGLGQKWLILAALIIFCASILAGLVNYFYNMRYHQKASEISTAIASRAEKARSTGELERLKTAGEVSRNDGVKRNNIFLLLQIFLMIFGLALIVVFVGILLFREV